MSLRESRKIAKNPNARQEIGFKPLLFYGKPFTNPFAPERVVEQDLKPKPMGSQPGQ